MRLDIQDGFSTALAALDRSEPIGVPGPLPLPYVVAARSAQIVNDTKHRPSDQPVTIIVESLDKLSACVGFSPRTLSLATWLSREGLVHLQIPLQHDAPAWASGAVSEGVLGVSLAWRRDLAKLFGNAGYVYASSANITGEIPAATAAQLESALGTNLTILVDTPELAEQCQAQSGVIARVLADAKIELVRAGIQNELTGESGDAYLHRLCAQWAATSLQDTLG
jgi:tRNA A37 threonylcarbamoyladenosine synthetase subunit TsaC/SUA5/YrdC